MRHNKTLVRDKLKEVDVNDDQVLNTPTAATGDVPIKMRIT